MARNTGITDEHIIQFYEQNRSYHEMKELTGLSQRGIFFILQKHGIKRNRVGNRRTHHFDETFFHHWSKEMAWVLGLLITDGCIHGSSVSFSQKDAQILEKIKKIMGVDYALTVNKFGVSTLKVNSAIMVTQLKELGIGEKKSLVVPFPKVPKAFLPSLIRGVIDGDGWVHKKGYVVNVTSGSLPFATGLKEALRMLGFKADVTEEKGNKNPIYRIWVRGKEEVVRLALLLYPDGEDNYVVHKKERMQYWVNGERPRKKYTRKCTIAVKTEKPPEQWHVSVVSRASFDKLKHSCASNDETIETALSNGFARLQGDSDFSLDKKNHPFDKVRLEFPTSSNIVREIKVFAQSQNLHFIDVLEECVRYIK